jgi:hypothetical protein
MIKIDKRNYSGLIQRAKYITVAGETNKKKARREKFPEE